MCFDLSCIWGFRTKARDDWLSPRRLVVQGLSPKYWAYPMSRSSWASHTACFAQVDRATYSASVVDVDTERCLRLSQDTAPPASRKTFPVGTTGSEYSKVVI